jgi:hypothetical protein
MWRERNTAMQKRFAVEAKRATVLRLAKEWYRTQETERSEPSIRLSAAVESLIASEKEG